MFEIPKALKIGGHIYKIDYNYEFKERCDRYGHHDHSLKEIVVSDRCAGGQKRAESGKVVTLIHEVLHGLDFLTGQEMFDGDEGEKRCDGLSETIFQFLVDNKYLVLDDV